MTTIPPKQNDQNIKMQQLLSMVNNENKNCEAGAQSQRNKDEYFTFRSNEKEEKITQMR